MKTQQRAKNAETWAHKGVACDAREETAGLCPVAVFEELRLETCQPGGFGRRVTLSFKLSKDV